MEQILYLVLDEKERFVSAHLSEGKAFSFARDFVETELKLRVYKLATTSQSRKLIAEI